MKKTKRKSPILHFHICPKHGRWSHAGPRSSCNLSSHASCGFQYANDFTSCLKGKPVHLFTVVPPEQKLKKFISKAVKWGGSAQLRFFKEAAAFGIERPVAVKVLTDARAKIEEKALAKIAKAKLKIQRDKQKEIKKGRGVKKAKAKTTSRPSKHKRASRRTRK